MLFNDSTWFEQGIGSHEWNTEDIEEYLKWHRSTAPHHNYITGAAIIQRNLKCWQEPFYFNYARNFQRIFLEVFFFGAEFYQEDWLAIKKAFYYLMIIEI